MIRLRNACPLIQNIKGLSQLSFVPKHESVTDDDVQKLQSFYDGYESILLLTGAGVSTESGVPDYRSAAVGLYARSNHKPIQYQEFVSSPIRRKMYWARNFVGWPRFSALKPNISHIAIAEWEKAGKLSHVVTQNVDKLHEKAGNKKVVELHGSVYVVKCLMCPFTIDRRSFQGVLKEANPSFVLQPTQIRPDGDVELSQLHRGYCVTIFEVGRVMEDSVYNQPIPEHCWPICYREEYNIKFGGLEKLHPFDASKWRSVFLDLCEKKMVSEDTVIKPKEISHSDLLTIHTESYLNSLNWSAKVAQITEVPFVAMIPNYFVQNHVLKQFRYQTSGTILACKAAAERGWGLNIGGGFHHCSADRGGGFCAYADITLGIDFLRKHNEKIKKVLIVDLDAHQGNGHERDHADRENVYIMDVYNKYIYPHDAKAKESINRKVELIPLTEDDEYLELVKFHLECALNEFQPDFVFYNAGTDILERDPLGGLSITDSGIIKRDELVFTECLKKRNIPTVMVTSGGYQRRTAGIISRSVLNLYKEGLIWGPATEEEKKAAL